jgi:hypothetical protein
MYVTKSLLLPNGMDISKVSMQGRGKEALFMYHISDKR